MNSVCCCLIIYVRSVNFKCGHNVFRAVEMVSGARLSVYDIREHTQPDSGQMTKRQNSEYVLNSTL